MYISVLSLIMSLVLLYQGVTYMQVIGLPHLYTLSSSNFYIFLTLNMVASKWAVPFAVVILILSIVSLVSSSVEEYTRDFRFKLMWFALFMVVLVIM